MANQTMRDSLDRRYPPLRQSWNTRHEVTYDRQPRRHARVGSQSTVKSFTQPFLVPPQSSRYEWTSQYPRLGTTDTLAADRTVPRTCSVSDPLASAHPPHLYEGDAVAESPRVFTKQDTKGYDPRIVDLKVESGQDLPSSKNARCQHRALYSGSCGETHTKEQGRLPSNLMEKPLPPVKHGWTQCSTAQQRYHYSTIFDQGQTTASSEVLEPHCYRPKRENSRRNTKSSSNPVQPQTIIDASAAQSSSPAMEVRRQSRPVPEKEDSQHANGAKCLDVDEIEEEITCPICMSVLVGTIAASPCGHVFCGGCGLEWIRLHETCPICRRTLSTPISSSLVPLHVMDALVEKWVKTKGSGWDGLLEWQDRSEVWKVQQVVWKEDLQAIETRREHDRQESHPQPLGHSDSGELPWGDFLLTDFISLGIHNSAPVEYVRPDPISAFLDQVSRLRRDIRTERDRYLSETIQALSRSPSMSFRPHPHHSSPHIGNDTGWESYSPLH